MNRTLRALGAVSFLCLVANTHAAFDCQLVKGKEGGDRIPLIFYAVGYTQAEKSRYEADVEEAIEAMLNAPPYREYREHFTIYRAWTPSLKSGLAYAPSDSTFARIHLDTATGLLDWPDVVFYQPGSDSIFSCGGRGQNFTRDNPGVLLVNSDYRGGVAFQFRWATFARQHWNTMLHELGHALTYLADEYEFAVRMSSGVWDSNGNQLQPVFNVWRNLSRDSIPWKVWLDDSVPIPTPATRAFADRIGVFEGADYQSVGRYRPALDCRMRSSEMGYCNVCREALTSRFLSHMGNFSGDKVSLDTVFPRGGRLTGGNVVVRRIPGDTIPVSLRWRFNGVWLTGVRETLDVGTLPGDGSLEAILAGESPFIRNPDLIPRDTLRWTVRKPSGTVVRKGAMDGIRRVGPGLFEVESGVSVPQWACNANGKRVPLKVVARTADGWLVRGPSTFGEALFLDAADKKTKSAGDVR
ncbi:MAG: hypothetical protein IPN71_19380 [Fibrobacteres bacterium]|nr:hypothetical protein [Fibrobacterota bacterium]QQS04936.1 MAG: hypothetical protein IPK50_22085 [Fibrobacterota bacterium]